MCEEGEKEKPVPMAASTLMPRLVRVIAILLGWMVMNLEL